jgi:subtilisin family serine protease
MLSALMNRANWKRTLAAIALALSLNLRAAGPAAEYVEGEVLVRFRPSQTLTSARGAAGRYGLSLARHYGWLSAHEGRVIGLLRSPTLSTAALLAQLKADPAVELAEPNYIRRPTDMRAPNDAKFSQLWGLKNTGQQVNGVFGTAGGDIDFLKAWGLAQPTTNEVVVGVIDTGIDVTHPDLVNNLWTNPGEIPGNSLDDDSNGYVDDVHGYDFSLSTGNLTDSGSHGTHVAGTIAASGNNAIGVIGVDFEAHLMGLKVSSDGNGMYDSTVIEALQYATAMKGRGVNIVALNASFGGAGYNDTLRSAIQAAGDAGIIFCAAAGNNSADNDSTAYYPASYRLPNMIVVAATDQNDALASFSDYGATTVDLAAPGVNVLSCLPVTQAGNATYVQQSTNTFSANPLTYSGLTSSTGITATIYYCGLGYPADFPAAVSNNIALIQRGTLTFSDKVSNATAAGARAAIIFNNVAGNFLGTLQTAGDWIPAISLSQADGQALQPLLPATGTAFNAPDPAAIYQLLNGTSMATPHVAGAVAFAAMNFPAESAAQRIQRLLASAVPVPGLAGKTITGGRLNLARVVDADNNGLPDWWELRYFGQLTSTAPGADPDADGGSNLAEFLAGTDPTNHSSALRLSVQRVPATPQVTVKWPSAAGRYYRLLRSTNSVAGFGAVVQSNIIATPPFNSVTDTPPAGARSPALYRLLLEP